MRVKRTGAALPPIAYYATAHGYGHGARSCDIIHALNELCPGLPLTIVSDLPESFFRNRLSFTAGTYRSGSFDVGMVQLDSIRVDVPATLQKVEHLYRRRAELIEQETEFLERGEFGLVVADIPAIPLEAAARTGIPRIAVGNFSWDWIYSAFAAQDHRWKPIIQAFREGYAHADLLLRLPFAGKMNAFSRVADLPLLASAGRARRREIAELTGCQPETTWILLSFTTLEWSEEALNKVERLQEFNFFTMLPLAWQRKNLYAIDRERIPYPDLVASVDAVLSKPGFGIVSECIVNRKPLIYSERSDFLEYAALEEGIRKYLTHVHIPAQRLYRGNLGGALSALQGAPPPSQHLSGGGSVMAACRIRESLIHP